MEQYISVLVVLPSDDRETGDRVYAVLEDFCHATDDVSIGLKVHGGVRVLAVELSGWWDGPEGDTVEAAVAAVRDAVWSATDKYVPVTVDVGDLDVVTCRVTVEEYVRWRATRLSDVVDGKTGRRAVIQLTVEYVTSDNNAPAYPDADEIGSLHAALSRAVGDGLLTTGMARLAVAGYIISICPEET